MVMLVLVLVLQLAAGPGSSDLVVELADRLRVRGEHPDVAILREPKLEPRHGVPGEHGREADVTAGAEGPPRGAPGRHLEASWEPHPLHEAADTSGVAGACTGGIQEGRRGEASGRGGRRPHVVRVVVVRPGEPRVGRGERGRDGGERGRRYGAGAGGGDDGRLGLLQQPLHGLAVGLVAELPRELEDPSGAERGHPDPAAPAVDLGVAVLVGAPLGRERDPPLRRRRRHLQQLLLLLPAAAPVLLRRLVDLDLQVVMLLLLLVLRRLLVLVVLGIQLLLLLRGRGGGGGGGRRGGGLRFV